MAEQIEIKTSSTIRLGASIVLFKNEPLEIATVIDSFFSSEAALTEFTIERKLVLIDNSPDLSLEPLKNRDHRIRYIKSSANCGYGAGHNQGIADLESWSDFHVVLNPDVRFGSGVLPSLIKRLVQDREIGLIMPKIVYPDGSLQFAARLLPTPVNLILRRFPFIQSLTEKSNSIYELRDAVLNRPMEIPFLSGCFMFMRMSVLKSVGGFDERFFMYLEDTDLSRRIGDVAKTIYDPSVSVIHEHQQGSYKSKRLMRVHIQSAVRYFNKWGWFFDRARRERNQLAKSRYISRGKQYD